MKLMIFFEMICHKNTNHIMKHKKDTLIELIKTL